jgi:small subunit ribosomal protein S17
MLETDENVNEETPEGAVDEAAAEPAAESSDSPPPADDAPDQVAEEVVAPEEPAEEPTADEVADESAPAEEAPAEEAPAEEAPAEEAAAPAKAAAPAEDAEPEEALSPKDARKRARSLHSGEPRPSRSIEERAQERAERRRTKARQRRAYRVKQRERRAGQPTADAAQTAPVDHAAQQGNLKVRQGIVVADKADKTITVRIDTARQHRMYKKIVRTSSTLHVHDEQNEAHVGDTVRVIESRPLSRTKRWRLEEVLERAR